MDQFEDEQADEKNDEKTSNCNVNAKITLLYDKTSINVCNVGHRIATNNAKHLSVQPCIVCGHRNSDKSQVNKPKPNDKQIFQFLNDYNSQQIPFGPLQSQQPKIKAFVTTGDSKKWPLHYAAMTGDMETLKRICKNKNVEIDEKRTDLGDATPITYAAAYGQLPAMIELIKNGAIVIPTPDKSSQTPYVCAAYFKHQAITVFFNEYIKYLYNFEINQNTNVECYQCYNYDVNFNQHILNGTMEKYVYCTKCTLENVKKVRKIQSDNSMIERRIIKTIKQNTSISVDTLCQMKDVKSLHSILKQIIVSGKAFAYWLWLLDIDNFKTINTHLTHAIADTKIQALGQVLKAFESLTWKQWRANGYDGIVKVWAFRQGGDEFALIISCNYQKKLILQKLYERLRNNIQQIKLKNISSMKHLTVSIGVCNGSLIDDYEEMMKKADEAAEMVKQSGKNGIAIYHGIQKKFYTNFNDVPQ